MKRNDFRIQTIWGESGPQKVLQRRPTLPSPLPEQIRQSAGKLLGSASYGTAVPIVIGRTKVPAVLIERRTASGTYLVCEGQVDNLGPVSYDNRNAVPYLDDPANYAPGSDSQGTGGWTEIPYLGRCVAWRSLGNDTPNLSYEVNGGPSETLQDVLLHDDGPAENDDAPLEYQAETWARGNETHLVYVIPVSPGIPSWRILYRRSIDGGYTWSSPVEIAEVGHALPAPIVFGDPDGVAIHVAWFQKRQIENYNDRDIEVKESFSIDGNSWTSRVVFSNTYTILLPLVMGQMQLSGSDRGGFVWISWQDLYRNEVNQNKGIRVFVAGSVSGVFNGRVLRSKNRPGIFSSDVLILDGAAISACPDGTAVVAFHSSGGGQYNFTWDGIRVYKLVVESGFPDWHPSIRSDVGYIDAALLRSTNYVARTWWNSSSNGGRHDSFEDVIFTSSVYGISPYGFSGVISAWYRLQWIGDLAGKSDCWALLFRSGKNGTTDPWKIRIGSGFSDSAPAETALVISGDVHCAPRWIFQGTEIILAASQADAPINASIYPGWNGSAIAWRWRYETSSGKAEEVEQQARISYVSGSDDLVHASIPTPNGLVVQEYGDFSAADAAVGRASRLIAWDPTAESSSGDVDPLGVLVRSLISERHLGTIWRAASNDFSTILKNVEETDKYCRIMGFQFSDAITSQVGAWDRIVSIMASANCDAVWSDGTLEFVPHEVLALAGGGETWTPSPGRSAPAYHLTRADFLEQIQPSRRPASEEKSILPISFTDRQQGYRPNTLDLMDAGSTEYRGAKKAATIDCPWIQHRSIAGMSAWMRLRKNAIGRDTWEVRLSWRFQRLQPMDLVQVTEPLVGLDGAICRVRRITRHSDMSLTVTMETAGTGYSVPTSPLSDDLSSVTPVWFAPSILDAAVAPVPPTYTGTGSPGVLFAVAAPPGWQGCDVWVRWIIAGAPTDWEHVGEIMEGSPMGYLSEPMGLLSPRPDLRPHDGLMPGGQDDWSGDFSRSMLDLPSPAASYLQGVPPAMAQIGTEYVAHFERANGTWIHRAKTLRRGLWGSVPVDHNAGSRVVVFRAGTPVWIATGRGTLEVRFPSKAVVGSAAEPLGVTRSFFSEVS